ncbi:S-layer homology domain-containing protein [Stenomitos frigidus]|nr:S-layer homology domain-containing protein [Stenomitos frigidus]
MTTTATTVVCSTLATFALYHGCAALFPHLFHPDDDSASDAKKDATKAEPAKTPTNSAIAAPETLPLATIDGRTSALAKARQTAAEAGRTASLRNLPMVNVPPTMRSLPTRLNRPSFDNGAMQNAPGMALSDADDQKKADMLEQSRLRVGSTQSLPFTSVNTPLSDLKGHWAQSFIESLAAKGVVRGFHDGSFRPDESVTAGQFALMTQKAFTTSPVSYRELQQLHPDRTPTRADAAAFIYQALATGQSAPLTMAVQVSGAVPRPGIYTVANGSRVDSPADAGVPTVSRAIQRAGGALDGADLRQVQIHRISETSARQVINVDVRQLLEKGDRSRDIVLQQGDKLFIPPATAAAAVTSNPKTAAVPTPERAVSLVEGTKN